MTPEPVELYLAKPTPERLAALYEKLTGRKISIDKIKSVLCTCGGSPLCRSRGLIPAKKTKTER